MRSVDLNLRKAGVTTRKKFDLVLKKLKISVTIDEIEQFWKKRKKPQKKVSLVAKTNRKRKSSFSTTFEWKTSLSIWDGELSYRKMKQKMRRGLNLGECLLNICIWMNGVAGCWLGISTYLQLLPCEFGLKNTLHSTPLLVVRGDLKG